MWVRVVATIFIGSVLLPHPAYAFKRVFVNQGTTSWAVVSDWSNINTVEVIGAGGAGGTATNGAGGGGGGGAYAFKQNITSLSGSITVQIGDGTGSAAG